MMVGDLPPSSSVTGVRFSAAARMTFRPASAEPVKMMWSKGRVVNSFGRMPGRIATISSGNFSRNFSARSRQRLLELLAILIMQRLPAARMEVSGLIVRKRG